MIETIKIPRKVLDQICISPKWISNGHWALIKAMLVPADQAAFATAEIASKLLGRIPGCEALEISDETMEKVLPSGDLTKWEFTGFAKVSSFHSRKVDLLEYVCGDNKAYFNREYLDMANAKGNGVRCETLLGTNSESAFIDEDRCFVIMPTRV